MILSYLELMMEIRKNESSGYLMRVLKILSQKSKPAPKVVYTVSRETII